MLVPDFRSEWPGLLPPPDGEDVEQLIVAPTILTEIGIWSIANREGQP
jgi:hypothetical protein